MSFTEIIFSTIAAAFAIYYALRAVHVERLQVMIRERREKELLKLIRELQERIHAASLNDYIALRESDKPTVEPPNRPPEPSPLDGPALVDIFTRGNDGG